MTADLLLLIKKEYRLHRRLQSNPLNWRLKQKFIKLSNEVGMLLKNAKYNYFVNAFNSCTSSKKLWNFVNCEILKKHNQESQKLPSK